MTTEAVPHDTVSSDDGGKGLKTGAIGLASSIVIGVASTAPAYSLAATLGYIVILVGLQAPAIVVLAFVPILFVSIGYQQLNKREPDCGTTFTWATKAFGPKTGWMGGWGIIAADLLVMASLAQVAGQYVFLLFGAEGIGSNSSSVWVLIVGLLWMAVMTYICYRGIEVSARIQQALLSLEVVVLVIFAVTALVKVYGSNPPATAIHPALSWFNPFHVASVSTFFQGIVLMLFIYWGWDSAVSVNEETKDRDKTPGRAAIISTVLLLVTYVIVTLAAQSFAGVGEKGIGLSNPDNSTDILSVVGNAVFGTTGFGAVMGKLLILLVLTSAAASTQTTILPTARTSLSMAAFKSIPGRFAHIHPKYLTPTQSTVWMGGLSALIYLAMNFYSDGNLIADAVTAIGMMIAFYYGLTGFACTWYYRRELFDDAYSFFMKGLIPLLGGIMLFVGLVLTVVQDWKPENSYVVWTTPWGWVIGWAFLLGVGTVIVGVVLMLICARVYKPFFAGLTLNRDTPIFLAEGEPITVAHLLPDDQTDSVVIASDFSNLPHGAAAIDPLTGEERRKD
ncbi:amino acid/polyamine/organocation transporter (APC superfamily) [Jatrophihabitans sp. GAS493]|uniref:APC family permease n=1 Tax=Jatrophihabitans sp. GAS493 TaxID=1907575 RepID=UPI000BB896B2|nr:APC family permease [Jatrophihabitans sp. GAS493]SOD74180.1 amino acid/polyamine/organocation transporter (APC superfamily) [Jatrophihabitans sp. GAS493]